MQPKLYHSTYLKFIVPHLHHEALFFAADHTFKSHFSFLLSTIIMSCETRWVLYWFRLVFSKSARHILHNAGIDTVLY